MTRTHGRCANGQRLVAKTPFGKWRTLKRPVEARSERSESDATPKRQGWS